jgi:hypothetical protein
MYRENDSDSNPCMYEQMFAVIPLELYNFCIFNYPLSLVYEIQTLMEGWMLSIIYVSVNTPVNVCMCKLECCAF